MAIVRCVLFTSLVVAFTYAINCYNCVGWDCKRNSQECTTTDAAGNTQNGFCYIMKAYDSNNSARES